ncbi:hypothetical protein ACIRRH_41320 [Kitasatospora sp. NPDC101235]|uniref:hypothetical protein n=1 Tax=Kitasatospora sp. NPDC101235 TaxID=3364101 RepID=UPI003817F88E
MTGPEHYREATRLAQMVKQHPDSSDAVALATVAQAHATLALAAATALINEESYSNAEYVAWQQVAGQPNGGA